MTTTNYNFISRDEFDAHLHREDQRFDELTEIMLGEFDKIYNRFDYKIDGLDTRIGVIETRMASFSEDMKEVKVHMKNTTKRLMSLEDKMDLVFIKLDDMHKILTKLDIQK